MYANACKMQTFIFKKKLKNSVLGIFGFLQIKLRWLDQFQGRPPAGEWASLDGRIYQTFQVEIIVQIFAHVWVEPYATFKKRKTELSLKTAPPLARQTKKIAASPLNFAGNNRKKTSGT